MTKISGITVGLMLLFGICSAADDQLGRFRESNPTLAQKYVLMHTSVELEIEHENLRFAEVMLAIGEFKELLSKDAVVQGRAKQRIDLQREQHNGAIKWWESLRAQLADGEELYLFSYSDGAKNESGYLTIKQGVIVKRFSQTSETLLR